MLADNRMDVKAEKAYEMLDPFSFLSIISFSPYSPLFHFLSFPLSICLFPAFPLLRETNWRSTCIDHHHHRLPSPRLSFLSSLLIGLISFLLLLISSPAQSSQSSPVGSAGWFVGWPSASEPNPGEGGGAGRC